MPKAPQQGNCILISPLLCVLVLYNRLLCLAFALGPWNSATGFHYAAQWDNSRSSSLSVAMLQQDHIHTRSSKLLHSPFLLKCKKKISVVTKKTYFLLVCRFDMRWLLSTRRQKESSATTAEWHDNLMDTISKHWLWGSRCWVQGGVTCLLLCVAVCEVVLCVSIIMGSESSKQAGAVEKRPPGSQALSCHYRQGRPDNNGDIMRAGDRLSPFISGRWGRICSVPTQQAHSHWLVPGLS